MTRYRILYTARADRDLAKLAPDTAKKVVQTIHEIGDEPHRFIKKLKASSPEHPIYSLRVGREIRVLLSLHDDVLIIHVLEVEHRKHSYRDF